MIKYFYSPIGLLQISGTETHITQIQFIGEDSSVGVTRSHPDTVTGEKWALGEEAKRQLEEYFAGKRKEFDLPLQPEGTSFQQAVWKALQTIPFGETQTYGEIAKAIGKPKASRAIGQANNRNPIVIIIPCHRVIGANKQLTGYAGGLWRKEFLLNLENNSL
jgi:methylated-DNA-[protein]-cysteine S-methyltransferase